MATYSVTFNMTSRATVTDVKIESNCSTVEELVKTLYSNSLVMCPEHYGEMIVVNMRNVETMTVRKMEE